MLVHFLGHQYNGNERDVRVESRLSRSTDTEKVSINGRQVSIRIENDKSQNSEDNYICV